MVLTGQTVVARSSAEQGGRALSRSRYPTEFRSILSEIRRASAVADYELALEHAERAISWGRRHADRDAKDRGLGNRAQFLIGLGRLDALAGEQRALLMRSSEPVNRYFAAYNLSLLSDREGKTEKGIFYARLALEQAIKSGRNDFTAFAHHQVATQLVVGSHFDQAYDHGLEALRLLPDRAGLEHAVVHSNVGYCAIVTGRHRRGALHLLIALRILRSRKGQTNLPRRYIHLLLCYAYIELERFDRAYRHGTTALAQADAAHDAEIVKKALYLLGEVAKQTGDIETASALYLRLQQEHYPDNDRLCDMLMQTETHRLVNLWT